MPLLQIDGDRKYVNRYREPPPYDAKAYYGRSIDQGDPFERERYREWEREYREWYEKYFKNYSNPPGNMSRGRAPPAGREPFTPERFAPPRPRENSPYGRGRREEYSAPSQSHSLLPRGRHGPQAYQDKFPFKEGHGIGGVGNAGKEPQKGPKDREPSGSGPGDPKGLKHKKHRKKRKGEEGDSFSHSDSMDDGRKEDRKGDGMLMASSRDDATPVRDEPMESPTVPYKATSDKDRREKVKGKSEKLKRKPEANAPKKESSIKTSKSCREKEADLDREKSPHCEPAVKRAKDDFSQKVDSGKQHTSQREDKAPPTRRVVQKPTKHSQESKPVKEEPKVKKEHVKEAPRHDKAPSKDEKPKTDTEKAIKSEDKPANKTTEAKPEKRKRKEEKAPEKEPDGALVKSPKVEATEVAKGSPKPKPKPEGEKPAEKERPAIRPLMEKEVKPVPLRKIKINREIGKKIGSTDSAPIVEESSDGAGKSRPEKTKSKIRRKIPAPDGSSLLVDYTR